MKILMVGLATFDQMAGGSARYLTGVADGLRALGHDVPVLTAADHVRTPGFTESGIIGQLRRAGARLLVGMPRTASALLVLRPDVLNVHFALDGLPAVLVAGLRRTPMVVSFHGPWALESLATGRRGSWPLSTTARFAIEAFVYRRARRCIALSDAFAEILRTQYGVRPELIRVIPGGIDVHSFSRLPGPAEARRRLGLPEAGYTMVTVRRLVPRMGVDIAIEALSRLEGDFALAIAGSGPERPRLEELARARGVEGRTHFLGRVADDQLPLVYAAGDVCVVPSRELEGFGFVALEALASGRPVIAAGTGGLREVMGRLEPRWIVAPRADDLAVAVQRLRADRGAYPSGTDCSEYAATMDWSRILPRVMDVFAEAVEDAKAAGRPLTRR